MKNGKFAYKVIIGGDGGVGKTTFLQRYVNNKFVEDTKMTIGVGFLKKEIKAYDSDFKLQLWDFGGQERFRFMLPSYCRGAVASILAFDVSRYETFLNLVNKWHPMFEEHLEEHVGVIIGTKADLEHQIQEEEINEFAKQTGFKYFETSSLTGENVDKVFSTLVQDILKMNKII